MKYIVCNNIEEFNFWNEKIHSYRQSNVSNFNDEKWSSPIIGFDGGILCPILDEYVEILEADAKEVSELNEENYFPKAEK